MSETSNALQVQIRVFKALAMRETKTLYGQSKLGYIWSVLEPVLYIMPIALLYVITGKQKSLPHGMTLTDLLVSGECAFLMFSANVMRMIPAVRSNRTLLTYPQVTPLDIMLARAVMNGLTKFGLVLLLVGVATLLDLSAGIRYWPVFLTGTLLAWLLGFSFGLFATALVTFFSSLEFGISAMMRLFFLISGVFYSYDMMPAAVRPYIIMNPLFVIIELTRRGFCPFFSHEELTPTYPFIFSLCTLFLGLVLERLTRKRQLERI